MDQPNRRPDLEEDRLLDLLAERRRRQVLETLVDSSGQLSLDELARAVSDADGSDEHRTRIELHHTHLPKLAEAGVVSYDREALTAELETEPAQLAADIENVASSLRELVMDVNHGEE